MSQSLKEVCILLSVNSLQDMPRFSSVFYSRDKLGTEIFSYWLFLWIPFEITYICFWSCCLEKVHNVCTET